MVVARRTDHDGVGLQALEEVLEGGEAVEQVVARERQVSGFHRCLEAAVLGRQARENLRKGLGSTHPETVSP